jgi:hypothetical protein
MLCYIRIKIHHRILIGFRNLRFTIHTHSVTVRKLRFSSFQKYLVFRPMLSLCIKLRNATLSFIIFPTKRSKSFTSLRKSYVLLSSLGCCSWPQHRHIAPHKKFHKNSIFYCGAWGCLVLTRTFC